MAFENLKIELAMLMEKMNESEPHNLHEVYEQVREKLSEMKAFGLPLPEDLVRLEEELEERFSKK